MTREWLETIRALAHKSTLGQLLMIAPPGSAESDNMRCRLDLLADFAQHVVESVDDDELRAAKVSREAFATGSHSDLPTNQKYKLVERGELFQPDDESLDDNCETWSKISHWQLRSRYDEGAFVPHRRPIQNRTAGPTTIPDNHSDPQVPDRRTGPPDRRLPRSISYRAATCAVVNGHIQRVVGRRSTDKR